jgi:excisionase family DNA binding protein
MMIIIKILGGIFMKTGKFKSMLILTLQQTNELLSSLVTAINNREDKSPLHASTETEKYPDILSVERASRFIGYSRSYIYKLIHLGKIPCHKPTGGRIFFKKSELVEFLLSSKQAADYEVSSKADEILNRGETKRLPPHPKNRKG